MERNIPVCQHTHNILVDQHHVKHFCKVIVVRKSTLLRMTGKKRRRLCSSYQQKKPSVLRRDMVNEIPSLLDDKNEFGYSNAAEYSLPCDDDDAIFDDEEDGRDMPTFTFRPAPQECAVLSSSGFMSTTQQKWTVALLKLLDNVNAPDYAFRLIIEWALSAKNDGNSFYPPGGVTARNAKVDILFKSLPNATLLPPSIQPVLHLDGSPSKVIVFDFVPQILRLLQNPSVMTPENLAIDFNAPLLCYESNVLGEALSGSVYHSTYKRFITNPSRQLFVPIIQWIDRTSVTGNDRFSLKPYMFTPAIFTESFRRTFKAWGYHGFLPKCKKSSAQKIKGRNKVSTLATTTRSFVSSWKRSVLPTIAFIT